MWIIKIIFRRDRHDQRLLAPPGAFNVMMCYYRSKATFWIFARAIAIFNFDMNSLQHDDHKWDATSGTLTQDKTQDQSVTKVALICTNASKLDCSKAPMCLMLLSFNRASECPQTSLWKCAHLSIPQLEAFPRQHLSICWYIGWVCQILNPKQIQTRIWRAGLSSFHSPAPTPDPINICIGTAIPQVCSPMPITI